MAYLAILIMLFYREDRWAYLIGILAPAVWLVMTFATGLLGGAWRQVRSITHGRGMTNPVSMLAAVSAVLGMMMIACERRWKKEYAGLASPRRPSR